jgi:hypothetical protein
MTELQALNDSIDHWGRMIECVKQNSNLNNPVSLGEMVSLIGETWYAEDCALCDYAKKLYQDDKGFLYNNWCGFCCLRIPCTNQNSLWQKVGNASTWGEWLEAANLMLDELKKIRKKIKGGKV